MANLPPDTIGEGDNPPTVRPSRVQWTYDVLTGSTSHSNKRTGESKYAKVNAGPGMVILLETLNNTVTNAYGSEHALDITDQTRVNGYLKGLTLHAHARSGRSPGERGHYQGTVTIDVDVPPPPP